MKNLVCAILFLLLLTPSLIASEDLSGKWSGAFNITVDGQTKDDEAYLVLKQTGTELTGTAGPNADKQWPIQKGKVEGAKITFEVQSDEPLIKFNLTFEGGRLKGEASAEHQGMSMKAAVDLARKTE
jgi:preprotein translocase subunit SecD